MTEHMGANKIVLIVQIKLFVIIACIRIELLLLLFFDL